MLAVEVEVVTTTTTTTDGPSVASSRNRRYQRSLELHRQIEALYSRVEQHRAFFRVVMPVDRRIPQPPGRVAASRLDPVVCALAIKAATTKSAVVTLCAVGDGQNALALTRVLLENACLLEWLNRGEGRQRLEAYVMFLSVQHERIARTVQRHEARFSAAGAPAAVRSDPYHHAVWTHVFQDNKKNKTVPTRSQRPTWELDPKPGQLHDIAVRDLFVEIADGKQSFEHDVLYGALGSEVVHSGPFSLLSIQSAIGRRDTFVLRPVPVDDECTVALAVSNTAMLLVLDTLTEYMGLDLSSELVQLKAQAATDPEAREEAASRAG